jgi:Ca2+-binding EF-hand superfamily protein
MREAFSLLDRSSAGTVNRDDVSEMLSSLGLTTPVPTFFTPSTPHPLPLPTFLSTLSALLAPLSPPAELLAALSAFDDDDSGQIEVDEIKDALLNTAPEADVRSLTSRDVDAVLGEWVSRRAFGTGKKGKREAGDVFRYREWVGSLGPVGEGEKAT